MAEKEFAKLNLEEPQGTGSGLKPKMSESVRKLLVFLKFILGVCLLPFVYAASVCFLKQFSLIDPAIQSIFWRGVITFILIYLFVWEPVIIYVKGQKLLELIFIFFKPLVRIAPYLLPIYTILLIIIYGVVSWAFQGVFNYFIFLLGFTIAFHLIFSAKTLRSKKDDFFKTNYLFGFSLIYILNLLVLSFAFSSIFTKFSFVALCQDSYQMAQGIFNTVLTQLFVNK
jgi:hypothetical protein